MSHFHKCVYNPTPFTGRCQTVKDIKIRSRPRDTRRYFNLPPDTYADGLKHHMIETFVGKKLTARGPYDTFTGQL